MKLKDALGLQDRDVIAFIGAGGKTTALLTLANELITGGANVIITTTTKMADYEMRRIGKAISIDESSPPDPLALNKYLKETHALFLYNDKVPGKVRGLSTEFIDDFVHKIDGADYILIEADGSKQHPFKAMHLHEPVIPETTTHIVYVVGMTILDQSMDESHVYGLDRIRQVITPDLPERVDEFWIASVLLNPEIGLKDIPLRCAVSALLNQAESTNIGRAEKLAEMLLVDRRMNSVLIGSVENGESPVLERRNRVGVVLFAAGLSERMGTSKLLLEWQGKPLIAHLAGQALMSQADIIVAVVGGGDDKDEIRAALRDFPLLIVHNPVAAADGMISSVQLGIQTLENLVDACLILHGDLPFITCHVIDAVIKSYWQGDGNIIIPTFEGRRGHPVLFDRFFWSGLSGLKPGKTPRDIVMNNESSVSELPWGSDAVIFDIDCPEQYDEALMRNGH